MKHKNKIIMRGALALMLVTISNSATAIVDGSIAGHFLGEKALVANGMCDPIYSFCAVISGLFTYGIGVAVFKLIGSGKSEKGNSFFTSIFVYSGIISSIILIILLVFCDPIVSIIGGQTKDQELLDLIKQYYLGLIPGIVFLVLFSVIIPISQLNGKNKSITLAIILSVIVNVIADIITVTILDWGLFGIAVSTTLSNVVILIILLSTVIGKNRTVVLHFKNLKFEYLLDVASNGLPYAFRRIANVVTKLMYNYFIVTIGTTALMAGFASMWSVRQFFLAFGIGVGSSITLIIGYYVGLRDQKSVDNYLKSTKKFTIIVCCIISVSIIVLSPIVSLLFTSFGSDAFYYSIVCFVSLALSVPFSALVEIYLGYLLAIEKKLATNVFMLIERAVIPIICMFILSKFFNEYGLIATVFISESLTVLLLVLYCSKIKKSDYYPKLFSINDNLLVKITDYSEIETALDTIETFLKRNKFNETKCLKVRLCIEEVLHYTITNGFKNKNQNYIEVYILIDKKQIMLSLQDNCKNYKLFNNIPAIATSSNIDLVGLKLVVEFCNSVKQIDMLGSNNIQIQIK